MICSADLAAEIPSRISSSRRQPLILERGLVRDCTESRTRPSSHCRHSGTLAAYGI